MLGTSYATNPPSYTMEPNATISTVQAAEVIGVSDQTVRNWIDRGAIPGALRFGRNWRVPASAAAKIAREGIRLDAAESASTGADR